MKKLLVSINQSQASKQAAKKAIEIAKFADSEVTFINVVELFSKHDIPYIDVVESYYNCSRNMLEREAIAQNSKLLDEIVNKLDISGIRSDEKVVIGKTADQIVKIAKEGNYDLIVLGVQDYTSGERFFTGSVTMRVLSDAPCSVFVAIE